MQQYSIFQVPPSAVEDIQDFGRILSQYLPAERVQQVQRAYYFAEQAHEDQVRQTGEPYVTHPLAVAGILSEMQLDHQSLMAALLHDVIEDTPVTKAALSRQFGESVADLVDGVSKLTRMEDQTRAEAQAENFQKMTLAMARDIRVILVKMADRLHNMRTLGVLSGERRHRIARETLDIYAPIAARLGMHNARIEFEDRGFEAMHPMRSRRIRAAVNDMRKGRGGELVNTIQSSIESRLTEDHIDAEVVGREKHLYSIYRKMKEKNRSFRDILDIYGFRIVVKDIDTCYRVLGAVHGLYKPVPGQFKDYIAIPKANGYQSLHTILFAEDGLPIELQIRTREMEELANYGIASHWMYKSRDTEQSVSAMHHRAQRWVQSLVDLQERTSGSLDFIENVKVDLFPDEVYVFTPRGDIMELPQGSTAVDFAYAVHSDIGDSCVACRINRHLAPLSLPLKSGQTVEVVTSPGAQPNPAWLQTVVTAKARSAIRHYLRNQKEAEAIKLGQRMLGQSLAALGINLEDVTESEVSQLLATTGLKSLDKIHEQIGLGNRAAPITARQLAQIDEQEHITPTEHMEIHGTEGFVVSFPKCCYPIPGDAIVGLTTADKGLVVHQDDCKNVEAQRYRSKTVTALTWGNTSSSDKHFSVELCVHLRRQRSIIAALATRINSAGASIKEIIDEEEGPRMGTLTLVLGVSSRDHLATVVNRIRKIPEVGKVSRVRH